MKQTLFIKGPLPGFNEMVAASKRASVRRYAKGKRWNGYNELKSHWGQVVQWEAVAQNLDPVKAAYICFLWHEKNMRRDPDNIAAAKKLVLDGLVKCGILPDDTHKHVQGFSDEFEYKSNKCGVTVKIEERN